MLSVVYDTAIKDGTWSLPILWSPVVESCAAVAADQCRAFGALTKPFTEDVNFTKHVPFLNPALYNVASESHILRSSKRHS